MLRRVGMGDRAAASQRHLAHRSQNGVALSMIDLPRNDLSARRWSYERPRPASLQRSGSGCSRLT